MKVMKKGVPPKEPTQKIECHACHSELEFTKFDVQKHGSYGDYGDASTASFTVTCPVCQMVLSVKDPISWH